MRNTHFCVHLPDLHVLDAVTDSRVNNSSKCVSKKNDEARSKCVSKKLNEIKCLSKKNDKARLKLKTM